MPPQKAKTVEAPARPLLEEAKAPKPFVGQEHVVEYFRNVGLNGLAHAYLLHGPRGVGKRTFARALALTIHCEHPTSFPLGFDATCSACLRGFAGSSGDTLVVDAAFIRAADALAGLQERKTDDMSIEAARSLIRKMQMRSYEGGRMVCIIPDFENVTGDVVYNALLKELEEPDPGKLFLLTVEHPESVLPTIRSRTVDIAFRPLRAENIARQLERHYGVKKNKAIALARRAQGSLGDAIDELDEEVGALRESARTWALACLSKPGVIPPTPHLSDEDRASARADLQEVIRQARVAVRDVAALAVAGDRLLLDPELAPDIKKITGALGDRVIDVTGAAMDDLNEAERMANTNVAPMQILGWLGIRLRSLQSGSG